MTFFSISIRDVTNVKNDFFNNKLKNIFFVILNSKTFKTEL